MNQKSLIHSLIISITVTIMFFWVSNPLLAAHSLQLAALLLVTFIITHRVLKPDSFKLAESTTSTMAVILVTYATGGITSSLFWLNYFLLFELSLLLEPIIAIVLTITLFLFYFFTLEPSLSPFQLISLTAFLFMTPLAYFFGRLYETNSNQKKEIHNLSKLIQQLKSGITEEVKKVEVNTF